MINPNQFLPFPYFYHYFDLQSFYRLQSAQKNLFIPQRLIFPYHQQAQYTSFPLRNQQKEKNITKKPQSLLDSLNSEANFKNYQSFKSTLGFLEEPHKSAVSSQNKVVQRNETKNISKNFGKAILSFAKSNSKFSKKLLKKYDVEKQELVNFIKKARKDLNSLQDLRQMWGANDQEDKLKKCLRIISHHFMRKHCLAYVYNSRIKSVSAHTKYRHRLMEGMSKPSEFKNIKLN